MSSIETSPWLARGLYLFGLALMLTAAIDLFSTVWPLRLTDMTWRYGFLGLAAGYVQTPTLGLLLIIVAALWEGDSLVLKTAGWACVTVALVLIVVMGLFALDVMAMRQIRTAEAQVGVLAGGIFQEIKYFVAIFVFGFLGHGALKTAKKMPKHVRRDPGIVSAAD